MANVFAGCKTYGGKWMEVSSRKFNANELAMVTKAVVVSSQYGASACFFMSNGTTTYIPMSNDAKSGVGEVLKLSECEVVTLEKAGEANITRIRG